MYIPFWDDIVNKEDPDLIKETNFDKIITLVTSSENIIGIGGFKEYYKNIITGFSNISFKVVDAFGQGNNIVKHWIFKRAHTGHFFWNSSTNKKVNIAGVSIVQMKYRKIIQKLEFMDNLEIMH